MMENIDKFELRLEPFLRKSAKPYYTVILTRTPREELRTSPYFRQVGITEAEAKAIVVKLASSGFLERAVDRALLSTVFSIKPGYILQARYTTDALFEEPLEPTLVEGDVSAALLEGALTAVEGRGDRSSLRGRASGSDHCACISMSHARITRVVT